jgi:hypothetical protein
MISQEIDEIVVKQNLGKKGIKGYLRLINDIYAYIYI